LGACDEDGVAAGGAAAADGCVGAAGAPSCFAAAGAALGALGGGDGYPHRLLARGGQAREILFEALKGLSPAAGHAPAFRHEIGTGSWI